MLTGRRSDTLPRQSTAIPCISLWNFFLGKCEVDTTRAFMTNSHQQYSPSEFRLSLHCSSRNLAGSRCICWPPNPWITYFTLTNFRDMLRTMLWSRRQLIALGALTFFISVNSHTQRGALTVTRGLDQLTQEAVVILRGYVTSAKVEPHPQLTSLMTVVVSMSVSETVKGTPRKSLGIDHLKAVPFIEVDRPHRSRPRADQHRPACQLPQVG